MSFSVRLPLFILLFLLSGSAYANGNKGVSTCGNDNGVVTAGDPTLCKEDIALSLLEEIFPKIYREVLELSQLDDKSVPEVLGEPEETRSDIIFERLYQMFRDIAIWIFGLYLAIYALDLAGKKIRGEPLYENQGGKWNIARGVGMGTTLLVPYKSFFLGQILVFLLSLGALGFTNVLLSVFLNNQQETVEAAWKATADNPAGLSQPWEESRHHFYSRLMYNHLVQIELCRKLSADYQLARVPTAVDSHVETLEFRACIYGQTENVRLNVAANASNNNIIIDSFEQTQYPPFFHAKVKDIGRSASVEKSYSVVKDITFKTDPAEGERCEFESVQAQSASCGSMSVVHPNWDINPLVKLIGMEKIAKIIGVTSAGLTADTSAQSVYEKTYNGWRQINTLVNDVFNEWTPEVVYEVDDTLEAARVKEAEFEAAKALLKFKNNEPVRQLASFYHLSMMNAITVGHIEVSRENIDTADIHRGTYTIPEKRLSSESRMNSLLGHYNKAATLAQNIEEMQCFMYNYNLHDSDKVIPYLSGESDVSSIDGRFQFRCVDYDNLTVVGLQYPEEDAVAQRERLIALYDEKLAQFKTKFEAEVAKHAAHRSAVERSMVEAIKSVRGENIWVRIRQEGYLAMATYMFALNREVNVNKSALGYLNNNLSITGLNVDTRMISRDLAYSFEDDEWMFPDFNEGKNALVHANEGYAAVDPIVNKNVWIQAEMDNKRQLMLRTGGVDQLESVLQGIFGIGGTFDGLGIQNANNPENKRLCLTNPTKCPFSINDPFYDLTQLGHTMINTSTGFFSVYLSIKGITAMKDSSINESGLINQTTKAMTKRFGTSGSVEEADLSKLMKGKLGAFGTVAGELLDLTDIVMSAMMSSLGFLMGIVFVTGAFLAYAVPLIPYLYVYLSYVSWVMITFMASFGVFFWSMYWTRYQENKQTLLRTMYHYGGKILLKPLMSLASLLFAYYLFYAVSYFISMSIGGLIDGAAGTGTLSGIYHMVFKWFLIITIFAYGLKYVLGAVDDMTTELLGKLGVEDKAAKDRVNDVIKMVLYEKSESFIQQSIDQMNKIEKSPKSDTEKKADKIMNNLFGDK